MNSEIVQLFLGSGVCGRRLKGSSHSRGAGRRLSQLWLRFFEDAEQRFGSRNVTLKDLLLRGSGGELRITGASNCDPRADYGEECKARWEFKLKHFGASKARLGLLSRQPLYVYEVPVTAPERRAEHRPGCEIPPRGRLTTLSPEWGDPSIAVGCASSSAYAEDSLAPRLCSACPCGATFLPA